MPTFTVGQRVRLLATEECPEEFGTVVEVYSPSIGLLLVRTEDSPVGGADGLVEVGLEQVEAAPEEVEP